jgi:hypothetical protein
MDGAMAATVMVVTAMRFAAVTTRVAVLWDAALMPTVIGATQFAAIPATHADIIAAHVDPGAAHEAIPAVYAADRVAVMQAALAAGTVEALAAAMRAALAAVAMQAVAAAMVAADTGKLLRFC